MSGLIISVSGVRGRVDDELNAEVAARYANGLTVTLPPGTVVLGRDGRRSGHMLAAAATAGLCAAGRDVLDAGIAATPTLGILVNSLRAAGGLQITASHNPAEYNGLKAFGPDGRLLGPAAATQAAEAFQSSVWRRAGHARWGRRLELSDPHAPHLERLLAMVDAECIRRQRYRVLLDANHGAGGCLGRRLLESLGCEVHVLGEVPDGEFDHPPEPIAENLTDAAAQVHQLGAAVGFFQDPDADRLALVDSAGRYLGEEYTLAICADHVLAQNPGAVVANCATSRMIDDIAQRHKVPCCRSAVGEVHVVEAMEAHDAVIGGEGNGGVIDPRVGYVRDSFVAMALVLEAMAVSGQGVAELAGRLNAYYMIKGRLDLPAERVADAFECLRRRFNTAEASTLDGLRLDWPERWLLVRPSRTEPMVRLIVEAATAAAARELYDDAAAAISKAC